MPSQYEDFFGLMDEEKIKELVNYYEKTMHDRKFLSTWKNFYEQDSEMMSYIGYYIEASDALFSKIIGCLKNYNEIRSEILGMVEADMGDVITLVVERIRNTAADIDRVHDEVTGEFEDIQQVFRDIWKIYDDEFNIPPLPTLPKSLFPKEKDKK
jgi:GTP-dependent phosphoenolpyruvate carboxykinase